MQPAIDIQWPTTETAAIQEQERLRSMVELTGRVEKVSLVAGVDVGYDRESDRVCAGVSVLDIESLKPVEQAIAFDEASFPYIPGLLSFREIPALTKALAMLSVQPDIIVCDGHGYAHPRRFGLACHLGLLFDVPTFGCAKTPFIGTHSEADSLRGSYADIVDSEEVIGAVVRTQTNVKPVYVSTGHRLTLDAAVSWILELSPRFRLPETTRAANSLVNHAVKST